MLSLNRDKQKQRQLESPAELARKHGRKIFIVKYNLQLAPDALEWLADLVVHFEIEDEKEIMDTFEHLVKGCQGTGSGLDGPSKITVPLLEATYEKLRVSADQPVEGGEDDLDSTHYLKIVDAFKMPAWRWTDETQTFEKAATPPTLAPLPSSKARYIRDRFNIVKQVILRNEHFCPPAAIGGTREDYMRLTSIKNLLGRQGGHFLIFGLLARMQDGAFYLEDLDDKVELDLSEAQPESGLFTEGSFVLVDGLYTVDSIFKVYELGHPPSERRSEAMKIWGHHDFLGVGALSSTEEADLRAAEQSERHQTTFQILSDVHLDNFKILTALRALLAVYEEVDDNEKPALFILCGNFRSRPFLFDGNAEREYKDLFATLAKLLSAFPSLLAKSQFLLIPGPTDPWTSGFIPQPALPDILVQVLKDKVPNITFGSNPCRVRYFSQELVIFREDLMGRMMRNAVRLKETASETDLRKALVQTILDQAHLAPLPLNVRPILWDYDHALRLYPMPTTLILADKFDPYKLVYGGCLVFNPGSFARKKFTWSTYNPQMVEPKDRMEESELPGPDD